MRLSGKNHIGKKLSGSGMIFRGENPFTKKWLPPDFFEATEAEIHAAIEKAHEAFQVYARFSGTQKARFLDAIADEIVALDQDLIIRCMDETGLSESRILAERQRTIMQLKLFAQVVREGSWVDARIDTALPERKPLPKPDIRSMLKPLGPVAIFGASNFPLAFSVAGGDTASALAAGCPVVFKAHAAHPGTSEFIAKAILRAAAQTKMPDGVFSLLHGKSTAVGLSIVRHPLIKAVGFTGSFQGGKALFDEANKRPDPIPVYAEMGSSNPVFILPDALQQMANEIATKLSTAITYGVGQLCTKPGLIFLLKSSDQKAFRKSLFTAISESASDTMLTRSISSNFYKGVERLKKVKGVKVVAMGSLTGDGYVGTPTILETDSSTFLSERSLEEEVFGPSALLITTDGKQKLLAAAESLSGHLTAMVFGTEKDLDEFGELLYTLEQKVGRLIVNGLSTGVEVCHSMIHGGPFPASTDSRTTSVGTKSIIRFARPVCYQGFPQSLLPDELKDNNPLGIWRLMNGIWENDFDVDASEPEAPIGKKRVRKVRTTTMPNKSEET